jgi:hypothetical protein
LNCSCGEEGSVVTVVLLTGIDAGNGSGVGNSRAGAGKVAGAVGVAFLLKYHQAPTPPRATNHHIVLSFLATTIF